MEAKTVVEEPLAANLEAPLIVIVGPTASGKTSLAITLAERFGGEIICADSRTIYKGMDIGTAKPTAKERKLVPHWGLDLVEPGQRFTAANFQDYTYKKIAEIRHRGKVPFLVGGSGLYIDGVLFNYQYGDDRNVDKRSTLENLSLEELLEYCKNNNIKLPENYKNKRYAIRSIEQNGINDSGRDMPIENSIIVGIATDREELRTRIALRAEQLFEDGVVSEAKILGKKYGWGSEAMTGNIYPLVRKYLQKELTLGQLKEKFIVQDWRLAKRQLTWLRRNHCIQWMSLSEANNYLDGMLESWRKS